MDDRFAELIVRAAHHSPKRLHTLHKRFYVKGIGEGQRTKVLVSILIEVMHKYCKRVIPAAVWIDALNPRNFGSFQYYEHVLSLLCSQISITRKDNWPRNWFQSKRYTK